MITQLQKRPPRSKATPLFIFPDASGTISAYRTLNSLGRDVYAVAEPRADHGSDWTVPELSRKYSAAIRSVVPEGRIMVGGWSLGGMIAFQVASILARDPKMTVDGVLMLEVPFPDYDPAVCLAPVSFAPPVDGLDATTASALEKSIVQTVKILRDWQIPSWRRLSRPYTVMLRASERLVYEARPTLSLIDQFRDSPTLGWNEKAGGCVVDKSYPIPGHHFGIFAPEHVPTTSDAMAAATAAIEQLANADDDY